LRVEVTALRGDGASSTTVMGENESRLDVVLAAPPHAPERLTGIVRRPSGEPFVAAKVEVTVTPLVTGCDCVRWTAVTGGDGAFDLGPILDGGHRVVVTDPAGRYRPATRFPAKPGEPLEVWMEE
jgi:hypothetical protein